MVSAQSDQTASKTSRFFIALLPPPDVQAVATQLKEYFRDRYNSKAALRSPPHITLQAPFEWPDEDRDRLVSTLAEFRFQPTAIPVRLSGFGAFPPRVIYLNVEHTEALMTLQAALSRYLAETLAVVDQRESDRPFRPHLTVAFRDLKPAAFRRAWTEFEQQPAQFSFCVPEITLLRHDGRHWMVDQNFPL